jgi:hypothetical protein
VMRKAAEDQPTAVDRLWAQGMAYVRFATTTPELYRIATMGEPRPGSDVDSALTSSAFVHLTETVQSLIRDGVYPDGDVTEYALELLAVAHGIAALLISRPYFPFGDAERFADRVLRAACAGRIALGELGTDVSPSGAVAQMKGRLSEQ